MKFLAMFFKNLWMLLAGLAVIGLLFSPGIAALLYFDNGIGLSLYLGWSVLMLTTVATYFEVFETKEEVKS